MRKYFLFAAMLLLSTSLFAQLEKNKIYAGLSIGRGLVNGGAAFQSSPSVSLALSKHSLLTAYGEFTRGKEYSSTYFTDRTARLNAWGVGIGYTYASYFKGSRKLGWYLNASLSVNRFSLFDYKSGATLYQNHFTEKQFVIKPGLFFKPSPRVMVFAEFGGLRLVGDQHTNDFGNIFTIGIRIGLGKMSHAKKE